MVVQILLVYRKGELFKLVCIKFGVSIGLMNTEVHLLH